MFDDAKVSGTKVIPTKKVNSGITSNGRFNIYSITNLINSCDLQTQINGINQLYEYWNKYGPFDDETKNTHVFFDNLWNFAFEFEDPEINRKATKSLAYFALTKNKEYPILKLSNQELLEFFFENLKSSNIELVNNSICFFYKLCNNQDVFSKLLELDIFKLLFDLSNESFAPILMHKILSILFPKDFIGTPECEERCQQFAAVLNQIPAFVIKYVDRFPLVVDATNKNDPIHFVVDKALKCFTLLQKLGLEADSSFIIQKMTQLLQSSSSNVVASAVKFLGKYRQYDSDFFDLLIKISIKRTDVTRKVFKKLFKKIEMMSPKNVEHFFERLLYCCENLSLKFAEIAIVYLPDLLTTDNARDLRTLNQFIKLIDSDKEDVVNACLQGINRYFELAQQGGFSDEVIDFLADYTEKIEELSLSDNEVIAELGSLILERLP